MLGALLLCNKAHRVGNRGVEGTKSVILQAARSDTRSGGLNSSHLKCRAMTFDDYLPIRFLCAAPYLLPSE